MQKGDRRSATADRDRSVPPANGSLLDVRLGAFARQAAAEEAARQGLTLEQLLEHAARSYMSEAGSDRPARRAHGIPPPGLFARRESEASVELNLGAGPKAALEEMAACEAVTVEQLLHHALLLYLADLNSGRVTTRLLEELEDGTR